ncbi:MAG: Flp pilus assembly protein CpaB [Lachnospiraceae bacterium]|nr:Flp pilus assembly protein CpaB [Lachnospiraceae bacterium]
MRLLKNRTVIGVVCIVLALIICFIVTPLFNKTISDKTEIVRVTQSVKAGDEITEDMVKTVEVGNYNLPEDVVRNLDTVIGKYASADLEPGDYILTSKIADEPAAENAYLYSLNGEKQAISVTVKSFANGLSGKLKSGDIVSVIAPDYKKQGTTVIPPELKYVEVIAVTANSGNDANTGDLEEDEDRELPDTVTLLVTPEQSQILAELEEDGTIHLSLVYRGEQENAAQFIAAQDAVLEELYAEQEEAEADGEEVTEESDGEESEDVQEAVENPEEAASGQESAGMEESSENGEE